MILGYAVFEKRKVDLEPRATFEWMFQSFHYFRESAEKFTPGKYEIKIVPIEIEDKK